MGEHDNRVEFQRMAVSNVCVPGSEESAVRRAPTAGAERKTTALFAAPVQKWIFGMERCRAAVETATDQAGEKATVQGRGETADA